MKLTKVTLRQRKLSSGKITLYLDYYPGIRNPNTNTLTRRESLGLYIIENPNTTEERKANREKLRIAEVIRSEREVAIIKGDLGFINQNNYKEDFIKYLEQETLPKGRIFKGLFEHFKIYSNNKCLMKDITVEYCNGFKEHLLSKPRINKKKRELNANTASFYWLKFKSVLAKAYKDKKLEENIAEKIGNIEVTTTHRQYLTLDELRILADTPCRYDVLRRASLFSCLTGLRYSDIINLEWDNITMYPDGGYCIRITTEKTNTTTTLPISDEAFSLCGERGEGKVFKKFTYRMANTYLMDWIKSSGIQKHITFHCFRHTYATLLLSSGVDIYTVSKMLTHKKIETTQIYTDVMDKDKRTAAEKLKIKK